MNPREAMKEMITFMLIEAGMSKNTATITAEKMHDDPTFLEQLEQFFQDHIEDFGENYGLY